MIQCIDNVFIFFSACFSCLFFIKQFKCCGLVSGAADWGQNFEKYSKSCECPDTQLASCISYDNKYVYSQVRTNRCWHSRWFCSFFSA